MNSDTLLTLGIVLLAVLFLVFKFRSKSSSGCGKSCGCAHPPKSEK